MKRRIFVIFALVISIMMFSIPVYAGNAWITPSLQRGGSRDTYSWSYGYDDSDPTLRSYYFDYGDGNLKSDRLLPGNDYITSHIFFNLGDYTQRLFVHGSSGNVEAYATSLVEIIYIVR